MKLSTMRRARRWVVQELVRIEQQRDGGQAWAPPQTGLQRQPARTVR